MRYSTRLLICCLILFSPKLLQDAWGDKAEQEKQVQQKGEAIADPLATEIEQEKKEARTIGALLLGLILFLGVVTIFFVVFWSKRMRRMIRHGRASPTQRDEFWYLQPDKNRKENSEETANDKPLEE